MSRHDRRTRHDAMPPSPLACRLHIERLEDRQMLAVFTVSNLLDGPVAAAGDLPGSLRQAIFDSNSVAGAPSDFDSDGDVDGDDFLIWQTNFGLADPFGRPARSWMPLHRR